MSEQLRAAIHAYFESAQDEGCVHFDKGYGLYAQCEDPDIGVPIRALAGIVLAAAPSTPEPDVGGCLTCYVVRSATYCAAHRPAPSTPEPGIDAEVLAVAMMNTLPDILDWEMHADAVAAEYARLASKDRKEQT